MLIAGGHNVAAEHEEKYVSGVFSHYKIKSKSTAEITGDLLGISPTSKEQLVCVVVLLYSVPRYRAWCTGPVSFYWETLQIMARQEMSSEPGFGQKGWKCLPFLLHMYICFPFPIEGEILLEQSENLCRSQVMLNTELPSRAKRS